MRPAVVKGIATIDTVKEIVKLDLERTVYKVTKLNNDVIVIKGDQILGNVNEKDMTILWGAKLMSATQRNKDVKMWPLTAMEFTTIGQFLQHGGMITDRSGTPVGKPHTRFDDLLKLIVTNQLPANDYKWYKMRFIDGLKDLEGIGKKENVLRGFVQQAENNGFWVNLGEILAVDIFIGNNDRFDLETGKLRNPGNLMFNLTYPGGILLGLDAFDRTIGNWSTARQNLVDVHEFKALEILRSRHNMNEFAGKVLRQLQDMILDEILGRNAKYGALRGRVRIDTTDFLKDYSAYILEGMEAAIKRIKSYIDTKKLRYAVKGDPTKVIPAGIEKRAHLLFDEKSMNRFKV